MLILAQVNFSSLHKCSCSLYNEPPLTVMYSRSDLQFLHWSLWSPSTRLPARLDSKLAINITLSRNFMLYVIVLFSFSFLIGTECTNDLLRTQTALQTLLPTP